MFPGCSLAWRSYLTKTLHLYQIPTFQKPNQPSNSDWMGPLIWVGMELDLQLAQERHQLPAHSFGSKNVNVKIFRILAFIGHNEEIKRF